MNHHPNLDQMIQPERSLALELLCLLSLTRTPIEMLCLDLRIEEYAVPMLVQELFDLGVLVFEHRAVPFGGVIALSIEQSSWIKAQKIGDAYAEKFPYPADHEDVRPDADG